VHLLLLDLQNLWYDAIILEKKHAILQEEDGARDVAEL
jgi:hypothetical protein